MNRKSQFLLAALVGVVVLLAACAPPSGVSVAVTCSSVTINYQGNASNDPADLYPITIYRDSLDPANVIANGTGPAGAGSYQVGFGFKQLREGTTVIVILDNSTVFNGPCGEENDSGVYIACQVGDGRINSYDCAAPVVIYCTANNIDIYKVDPQDGSGDLIIRLPFDEIPESGSMLVENMTLAEVGNVLLSYLTDGKLQVNTYYDEGKAYVITWDGCPATVVETLAS